MSSALKSGLENEQSDTSDDEWDCFEDIYPGACQVPAALCAAAKDTGLIKIATGPAAGGTQQLVKHDSGTRVSGNGDMQAVLASRNVDTARGLLIQLRRLCGQPMPAFEKEVDSIARILENTTEQDISADVCERSSRVVEQLNEICEVFFWLSTQLDQLCPKVEQVQAAANARTACWGSATGVNPYAIDISVYQPPKPTGTQRRGR